MMVPNHTFRIAYLARQPWPYVHSCVLRQSGNLLKPSYFCPRPGIAMDLIRIIHEDDKQGYLYSLPLYVSYPAVIGRRAPVNLWTSISLPFRVFQPTLWLIWLFISVLSVGLLILVNLRWIHVGETSGQRAKWKPSLNKQLAWQYIRLVIPNQVDISIGDVRVSAKIMLAVFGMSTTIFYSLYQDFLVNEYVENGGITGLYICCLGIMYQSQAFQGYLLGTILHSPDNPFLSNSIGLIRMLQSKKVRLICHDYWHPVLQTIRSGRSALLRELRDALEDNPVLIIKDKAEITKLLHAGNNILVSMSADAISDLEKYDCRQSLEWINLEDLQVKYHLAFAHNPKMSDSLGRELHQRISLAYPSIQNVFDGYLNPKHNVSSCVQLEVAEFRSLSIYSVFGAFTLLALGIIIAGCLIIFERYANQRSIRLKKIAQSAVYRSQPEYAE